MNQYRQIWVTDAQLRDRTTVWIAHPEKPSQIADEVIEHYPRECKACGEALSEEDASPYRHQIVELPPIEPTVIEH